MYKTRHVNMNIHSIKILKFIREKKIVTSLEVAKMLKMSWNTADSYLKELLIEEKLDRIKKERVTLWMIK